MITKKEVKHIAKLARLGLSEKEIGKFQGELSKILDYIEKLKEVDIKKITPTSYSIEMENVMRGDEEKEKLKTKKDATLKLLELAPETKNGYLKVKSIF
ncbi:MAG: asparaginyl/glutamyl-tRNA amidotransferase subunit C [Parcubacteria group bacterium CG2_30_36_18]|uniref:Aspartyl/glutamyl-tRNA(Asn/Gln) amidotransferase subunit C n=4 Tax=Candidatus Nealsoniibacteriota TaxID=1817911 RepID=A0A2M8DLH5_9BACT|nr:MAG: asparaginyl/glutamyl-tRNA amidotransferase subunit C [Parcubacteria group bacterium CG2_30_36_18]PIP24607.1 MAG: Asp-tRNA(Asn)/Glu-tRNA(Gln) amidotransferase GatCAB subunit C [Candidatus Nealsonbacteria bacterium CG23_combo_of_CG06-09_8_20_14_all_36_125]PIR72095.1 MAG: Asp-tRNA(Asn)/Glu-tRNA(Gln) amidotransferase GatCAB subunit C [Candidatus Nealsonbacteria bacterium CG10_big_fil_rev_8_21_14_0_10_36_228]PIX88362.1 MAG: Asp-tRNA(Asn)/Glu-tRNA(Gln) amidotransferase GatCAB subunit C [Candid